MGQFHNWSDWLKNRTKKMDGGAAPSGGSPAPAPAPSPSPSPPPNPGPSHDGNCNHHDGRSFAGVFSWPYWYRYRSSTAKKKRKCKYGKTKDGNCRKKEK